MTTLDDRKPDSVPVNDSEWLYLPGTPWSMRLACGSGGRPALEVCAAGSLLDVVVASSRASRLLGGACAMIVAGQARAIAWGACRRRACAPPGPFPLGVIKACVSPIEG